MNRWIKHGKYALFMVLTVVFFFIINVIFWEIFDTRTLIPMTFVLGVFFVSWRTQGYFWGIAASLLSVLAVNYAFTFPYYAIDLISPECVASAVVMLVVSVMTSMLTTKIKQQEKMKAEAEMERMRANLLRAVSHDLRTPLTSISGSCSAILDHYDTLKPEHQKKLLREMQKDSEWLIRMVENLLSVTRIDGERVQVTKTETVLEELIDAVLVKFRKTCPGQMVSVKIPDEFISIPMDAILIEQVLINILENAVSHAVGMKELCLQVHTEGNQAIFTVLDDGCGIPEDRMEKLFTGYLSADPVLAPADGKRSNMGIGLSVCSTIIKAHGGEIGARNREPNGAEFWFTLEIEGEKDGK